MPNEVQRLSPLELSELAPLSAQELENCAFFHDFWIDAISLSVTVDGTNVCLQGSELIESVTDPDEYMRSQIELHFIDYDGPDVRQVEIEMVYSGKFVQLSQSVAVQFTFSGQREWLFACKCIKLHRLKK
jgi:hypothetical protein